MKIVYCLGAEGRLRNFQQINDLDDEGHYLYIDRHCKDPFVYTTRETRNVAVTAILKTRQASKIDRLYRRWVGVVNKTRYRAKMVKIRYELHS